MTPGTKRTLIRIGAGIAFVLVLIWLMAALASVTTVLLVAFFLAYVMNPATTRLQSWGLARPAAALLMLLACITVMVGIIVILVPAMVGELTKFAKEAPRYLSALHTLAFEAAQKWGVAIPADRSEVWALIVEKGQESLPRVARSAAGVVSSLFGGAFRSALTVLSALVHIFLVPVIAYYLLVSFEDIRQGIVELIPPYTREPILAKLREIDQVLANFVRGQLTVAGILAVLYSLGFLVIGLDLAIVLGLVSGLLWVVPYLGTVIAVGGGTALALAQYGDIAHALYVWGWIGGVQVAESYLLTPRLVGHAVGLHPVIYILAVVVGANLFGFVGMLVAIPVTAVLKVLLVTAAQAYKKSYLYTDRQADRAEKR